MKRRVVEVGVTDHAVLRWLERRAGLDIEAVRRHLAGQAQTAAELNAAAVVVDRVRLILRPVEPTPPGGARVDITTVTLPEQKRGLGVDNGRRGGKRNA